MLKHTNQLLTVITFLFVTISLAACVDEGKKKPSNHDEEVKAEKHNRNEAEIDKGPQKGGTITGVMHYPPTGQFNPLFYKEAYDKTIIDFTHESLFSQNKELIFEADGLAKDFEINEDHTELIVYLRENVKWHDGKDFTADDVVYTYQTLADPNYEEAGGIHTNPYASTLLGFKEYRSGESDEFKGIEAEDDHTVVFFFEEPSIHPQYVANFPIIPKHIFKNIPVAEMAEADVSLQPGLVVGTGPFKFTEMVERDQYILERHEDYWQSSPFLERIVWQVNSQSITPRLLETGKIDFIAAPEGISRSEYDLISNFDHIKMIEQIDFDYLFLGFKHNHRTTEDVESGLIEPDNWISNAKLPQQVRQSIAYAIDREGLIGNESEKGLLHGRGQLIHVPIAPQSWAYNDDSITKYTYNPNKAAEILDEAGYKIGADGWRTDPDGNEWIIHMDYPSGNELRERVASLIKEYIEDVGIKIELRQTKEMSAYIPKLINDDTDWDLYLIGWSLSSRDPDPLGLWGIKATYNFSRWNNPQSDELLFSAIKTPEAFDQDFREERYSEWTHLFSEDLPALPLFIENKLWAYHKRIQGIEALPHTMYKNSHLWWVKESE